MTSKGLSAGHHPWAPKAARSEPYQARSRRPALRGLRDVARAFLAFLAILIFCAGAWGQGEGPVGIAYFEMPGNLVYLPLPVAEALGFFREAEVLVELKREKSATAVLNALLSGQAALAALPLDLAIGAKGQGKPIKLLAVLADAPPVAFLIPKGLAGEIRSVEDLKGRRLGHTGPGSASHLLLAGLLRRNGIRPNEAELITVGATAMGTALAHGKIQGAMVAEPQASLLIQGGSVMPLVDLRRAEERAKALGGLLHYTGLFTTEKVLGADPDRLAPAVRGTIQALQWLRSHSADEVRALLPQRALGEPTLFSKSFVASREIYSPDGNPSEEGVGRIMDITQLLVPLPLKGRFNPVELIDNRFLPK